MLNKGLKRLAKKKQNTEAGHMTKNINTGFINIYIRLKTMRQHDTKK